MQHINELLNTLRTTKHYRLTFENRFIYYVGPVDPVGDEVVGPAGPTTATRMDKFTRMMLEDVGILGMIGKAERGDAAIEAIRENGAVSLIAVGGAAYLVSQAIKAAQMIGFEDLKMEGIYEFEVEDMPVTVAVDTRGNSVHKSGPAQWRTIQGGSELVRTSDSRDQETLPTTQDWLARSCSSLRVHE